jgi:hypothetical protein
MSDLCQSLGVKSARDTDPRRWLDALKQNA